MRKIARFTSSFQQQMTKEQHRKDGISGLPDEILIAILSLLMLKEAACSSILSRRWRYLWRHTTGSFNFDLKTLLGAPTERAFSCSEHEEKRTTYTNWVNEILKLHLGTCIDEMRISFDFCDQYPRDINDWIKFAMEKGAQSHHVSRSIGFAAGFCSLTALRLVGVDITEDILENFLFNCQFLEQLGIEIQRFPKYCRDLGNLKQVEFFFLGDVGDCLLSFTSVIEMHIGPVDREIIREVNERTYLYAVKEVTKCHRQCLKVVELCGFDGSSGSEVELVLHILEIAALLEKIIIDTRLVLPSEFSREAEMEAAKERAKQLKIRLLARPEIKPVENQKMQIYNGIHEASKETLKTCKR
ncbi:F-box/FBD/LRR-repeat protein At4g00160-like [Cornus florida]|uniref:F-box/FBD/LRR-repeat protein At4g00160-like n=1 Tax=Cornus florida TaxID=4283 RepID=UPI0028968BCE|nr:F-box/FBD/LRR-repeat protein At4g00160-like [Cornus florida]